MAVQVGSLLVAAFPAVGAATQVPLGEVEVATTYTLAEHQVEVEADHSSDYDDSGDLALARMAEAVETRNRERFSFLGDIGQRLDRNRRSGKSARHCAMGMPLPSSRSSPDGTQPPPACSKLVTIGCPSCPAC